ncbi:uncharacterized protein PITG_21144 [Phytophthora infestans T30-4]|uniref:Uncharacterized protein n=1 Tax=Phytophthora infestans (strain T30-4) TaxID=403677 RepID=D0P3K2_PHYIT|nr:uncharacterized protein PITG_21144 [Phytophthora infestans T30-4]EEY60048.1 conserved hypothetical protein [Phytophthora infestans T30-4]|eukprot:XP_002895120.1 conserved hypothetical protein [Phytophthora infestans T30-4]
MKDEPPTPRHSVPRRLSRPRRASVDDEIIATPTAVRAAARAALKEEEVRPAAIETPRQPAKLIPRPPPVLMSRDSSASVAKTFLTAIVPGRRRSRRQKEVLRPPSPLDSVQPPCDYVDTGSMSELPAPANYMGMQAMQQFWDIFHRQETVHNNKAVPPTVPSVVPRPKSARTNYLAAVRNLRLCPEPLGIVRRRVVDKTASYANGSTVQEVNLSSYRMGNAYAEAFGEGFSLLPGVESLNLTHNRIGDLVASRLITAAAAAAGAQGTAGLQQLNLSHNALATASSRALSELMRRSRALTSLNLSHTGLRDRQVQQLCESLTMNQTVHRFTWTPTAGQGPFAGTIDRFEITPSMEVRLHLSVDDWRGVAMERRENDGDEVAFSALRVIPPGATCYFFTAVDTAAGPNSSNNVSFHYVTSRPSRPVQRGVFGTLERLNVIRLSERGGRDPCNTLVPRSSGKNNGRRGKWDINKSVFARRKRESECRSFVDTDVFIAKACAADWKQCKIDRFVKDSSRRREVEVSVTRWYRTVCNAYRRYCGHNVLMNLAPLGSLTSAAAIQLQNDITCIPWSGYTEFLSEAKILDETSEYCSLPDLENVFVAANLELTQEAKEKDNPDRSLTRFEFLECIIRIATNKYFRTNVCDTPAKAVDKLVQENIQPVTPDDANEFRSRFLYTEEVSDAFTEHITLLQELYDANMGKYCKPGEKKGMHLVEFLLLLEKYQVFSDSFRVRDIKDPFLACKLMVLDEMTTVGHKKLFLTDFMEIILRVSVVRYPPRTLTVDEVVRSLHKLLVNHFYKHDALVGQFCEAIDQALVEDRLEAFANAINSQRNHLQAPAYG